MSKATWEEEDLERMENLLKEVLAIKDMVGTLMGGEVKIPPTEKTPKQAPPKEQDGKQEYSPINTLQEGEQSSRTNRITIKGTIQYDVNHREGTRQDGTEYEVADFVLDDGTGQIKISFWDKHAQEALDYKKGDLVLIENVYKIDGKYKDTVQANAGKYYKMVKLN